jgi:hypothetical protein
MAVLKEIARLFNDKISPMLRPVQTDNLAKGTNSMRTATLKQQVTKPGPPYSRAPFDQPGLASQAVICLLLPL